MANRTERQAGRPQVWPWPAATPAHPALAPPVPQLFEDIALPLYDPAEQTQFDLLVAGTGPAGLAVADRVSAAGFSVLVVDPNPKVRRGAPLRTKRSTSQKEGLDCSCGSAFVLGVNGLARAGFRSFPLQGRASRH